MNRGSTARATIELSVRGHIPVGVLIDGDGWPHRFRGWIELAAAIEDWRISCSRDDHSDRRRARKGGTP